MAETNQSTTDESAVKAITQALAEPFSKDEVKFKPQSVKGNRALAMAYVDARCVQDRLDDVLGVENWQDEYDTLPDGSVVCKLTCRLGDRWITKVDVGGPSEQPDGGDRVKAAFSDALKRAAVKFGVGRYLYRTTAQWADYDPVKRQFTTLPTLPGPASTGKKVDADAELRKVVDQLKKAAESGPDALDAELKAKNTGHTKPLLEKITAAEQKAIRKIADDAMARELKLFSEWLDQDPELGEVNFEATRLDDPARGGPERIRLGMVRLLKEYADKMGWTWSSQSKTFRG